MNMSLTKNLAITQPLQLTDVNNLSNFEFSHQIETYFWSAINANCFSLGILNFLY